MNVVVCGASEIPTNMGTAPTVQQSTYTQIRSRVRAGGVGGSTIIAPIPGPARAVAARPASPNRTPPDGRNREAAKTSATPNNPAAINSLLIGPFGPSSRSRSKWSRNISAAQNVPIATMVAPAHGMAAPVGDECSSSEPSAAANGVSPRGNDRGIAETARVTEPMAAARPVARPCQGTTPPDHMKKAPKPHDRSRRNTDPLADVPYPPASITQNRLPSGSASIT